MMVAVIWFPACESTLNIKMPFKRNSIAKLPLKTSYFTFFLFIAVLLSSGTLFAETGRMEVRRGEQISISETQQEREHQRKIHPAQSLFPQHRQTEVGTRAENFDRLLVLLVDFQEDDNPKTTGNGKFVLEPDPGYPLSLGAPPRDYEYFRQHLEAMRYYYLAASINSYNLQYDIYPRQDSPFFAYTLPHEMAYYNPGMNNTDLFIERVEEYFHDIFRVADSYGEIDFSLYGHFMFIHAGSDWQHDVYGDTPHDIPSFFISIAEGKEAVVNNGAVKISSAANVPETISQDGRYGAINAVMAHEFGHSLGFVDLYNVRNFYPGVGYWDIMDSGGSTRVFVEGNDGEFYAVEGGIPALPGAWHRLLAFGDHYRDKKYFEKISNFSQDSSIQIAAASSKPVPNVNRPYIVKVPINEKEYLLLENRNVDPDGDGGIAIRGAHPLTPGGRDYRVILHPIAVYDDDLLLPTYEYDWLLPGWVDRQGRSYGGGIIVWHIDEKVIYDDGIVFSDGTFRSNYKNNSVNTNYYNRGIKIIEADNIQDVGNPQSWFWYGTEYEPYFRYKPSLDAEGYFQGWSVEEFNKELSSASKPQLLSKGGNHSLYSLYDISALNRVMSFKYRFEPFIETKLLSSNISPMQIASPGLSPVSSFSKVLPVFSEAGLYLFRKMQDDNEWVAFLDDFDHLPDFPVITTETPDGSIYYAVSQDKLLMIKDEGFSVLLEEIGLGSNIVESPLPLDEEIVFIPTVNNIKVINRAAMTMIGSIALPSARLTYNGSHLFAVSQGNVYLIDTVGFTVGETLGTIPDYDPEFHPISFLDTATNHSLVFLQDGKGSIYSAGVDTFTKIFSLSTYTGSLPSQPAFIEISTSTQTSEVLLLFAAGEHLFLTDIFGTLAPGYPKRVTGKSFRHKSHPRTYINDNGEIIFLLETADEGYIAYNYHSEKLIPEISLTWNRTACNDLLYYDDASGHLSFFFADSGDNLYQSKISENLAENPIIWNGYRNNGTSSFRGTHNPLSIIAQGLSAFPFPNPAGGNEVRIRVVGAGNNFQIRLFDISGKKVYETELTGITGNRYDAPIDIKNLSSGAYFGVVKANNATVRFNLAVEK